MTEEIQVEVSNDFSNQSSNDEYQEGPIMSHEEHLEAIKRQIEYYFSKENLQNDAFLASQMDANKSVSISVIMKFAKLKALTQDENLVRQSLVSSTVVSIVDDRIRANKVIGRSTIILREIPNDATEEEIKEVFNFDGCKPISSMRSDIENTWFVVMDSEDDAKETVLQLKLKSRKLRGEIVKARLKTETFVRSFYPLQPVPLQPPIMYPPMQFPGFPGPLPYAYLPPNVIMPMEPSFVPSALSESMMMMDVPLDPTTNNYNKLSPDRKTTTPNGFHQSKHAPNGIRDRDSRKGGSRRDRDRNIGDQNQGQGLTQGQNQSNSLNHRRGRNDRHSSSNLNEKEKVSIEINAINFPPLPGDDDQQHTKDQQDSIHTGEHIDIQRQRTPTLEQPLSKSDTSLLCHDNDEHTRQHGSAIPNETRKLGSWAELLKDTSKPVSVQRNTPNANTGEVLSNTKDNIQRNHTISNSINVGINLSNNSMITGNDVNLDKEKEKSINGNDFKPGNVVNAISSAPIIAAKVEEEIKAIVKAVEISALAEPITSLASVASKNSAWGGKPTFANILKQADTSPDPSAVKAIEKDDVILPEEIEDEKRHKLAQQQIPTTNQSNNHPQPNKSNGRKSPRHNRGNRNTHKSSNNDTNTNRSESDSWRRNPV